MTRGVRTRRHVRPPAPATRLGRASAGALALLLGTAGCIGSTAEPVGYTPVPDEQLFADVADLPGVRRVDLEYENSFMHPSEYSGDVTIGRGVDPVDTLDAVSAILWQGRPDPLIIVTVHRPRGVQIDNGSINLLGSTYLEERYGPQPGTGEVPKGAPRLARPPSLQ